MDFRFAVRMLLRNPGFSCVAILVLALGIGANTAIFSVVNAALLKPLPYREADRIFGLTTINHGHETASLAPADFVELKRQSTSFDDLIALPTGVFNVRVGDTVYRQLGSGVTGDFFKMLGTAPVQGRAFSASDFSAGAARVVVLSHTFWVTFLNSDSGAIGTSLLVDGEPHTIVGILSESFRFPLQIDLYRPQPANPEWIRNLRPLWNVFVKLKPGVSATQASAEIGTIESRIAQDRPQSNDGRTLRLVSLRELATKDLRPSLLIFQVSVGLVLLIACANVGNLLIARASGRRREMAIRVAVGANGGRLARQLLVESLVLSGCGGLAGLLLTAWSIPWLVTQIPAGLDLGEFMIDRRDVHIDATALLFTAICVVITAALFGLAPMLQVRRIAVNDAMKQGRRKLQGALVLGEVALALVLMSAAGLIAESFVRLQKFDPGYHPDRLMRARLALNPSMYPTPEKRTRFFDQVLERTRAIPGVESAAMVNGLPLSGIGAHASFTIDGRSVPSRDQMPETDIRIVTTDYFSTLQTPLLRGRVFDLRDDEKAPGVVLISESFAKLWWRNADTDPLGTVLRVNWHGNGDVVLRVVGIVGDMQYTRLQTTPEPMLYGFYRQSPWNDLDLREVAARTRTDPAAVAKVLRTEVAQINRDVPVYLTGPMSRMIEGSLNRPRFAMTLMGLVAIISLALAALGLYGVLAHMVGQRTKEFGIRMALGADRARLLNMVIREGAFLTVAGIVIGVAGSIAAGRILTAMMAGVGAVNVRTLCGVSAVLIAVAMAASWLPARRAMKVDPMIALRHD
jgi:putative ABC transport system permease protein